MVAIIVAVIVIVIIVLIIVGARMINIEVVEVASPQSGDGDADDEGSEDGEEGAEGEGGEGEGGENGEAEMVDLFDYFDEDNDKKSGNTATESVASVDDLDITATDKLTDFKSGRRYLVDCKNALESAKEENQIFCAVYFDYDRFKYINNLKGAASGDYVLTNTSQQVRRIFPEGAVFTRISCDHFAGVFPLVDMALFEDYYEQLRRMCEKIRSDIGAKTGIRTCVGFAMTDNDASYDVSVLLARANIARHSAKVTKAEKFEIYDESMIASNFYGDTMMDDYTECQYSDDIVFYFETQVDLVTDKIVGCDTLVRWAYEDKANEIITQDTGRIPTNNDKVIYQVCRAISRWRKAAREAVMVFVEVPVSDVFKADIDEFLVKCLTEFQVEPQTLVLKIDVSIVRIDWSMCSKQFKKFRDIGVKLCVMNMDTGYSNLDFLSGLSIDYVKLHRSFAHNAEKSQEQIDKCRKIMERASQIGAIVIFEGVDSLDQKVALKSINAKIVQGRYTGRPSTVDELTRSLPEHVERRVSDQTVILDEAQLAKGDWNLF